MDSHRLRRRRSATRDKRHRRFMAESWIGLCASLSPAAESDQPLPSNSLPIRPMIDCGEVGWKYRSTLISPLG